MTAPRASIALTTGRWNRVRRESESPVRSTPSTRRRRAPLRVWGAVLLEVVLVRIPALLILLAPIVAAMLRGGRRALMVTNLDEPLPAPLTGSTLRARISRAVYEVRALHRAEQLVERQLADELAFAYIAPQFAHVRPGDGTHARALAVSAVAHERLNRDDLTAEELIDLLEAIQAAELIAAATTPVHPFETQWGAPFSGTTRRELPSFESAWATFTRHTPPRLESRAPRLSVREARVRSPRAPGNVATAEPLGGSARRGALAR